MSRIHVLAAARECSSLSGRKCPEWREDAGHLWPTEGNPPMIVNTYTVSHLVLSGSSLAFGVGAAGLGVWAGWKRATSASVEESYRAEKVTYLAITLVGLNMYLRLFLAPFWFWTLQSLVPSIPGAMCLAGVHLANSPVSFISSSMKIVVPFFYAFWLIMNRTDRRIESQPLTQAKLFMLPALGLLTAAESLLDAYYLATLKPRPVPCCTSLFDLPSPNVPEIVSTNNWTWTIAFLSLSIIVLLSQILVRVTKRKSPLLDTAATLIPPCTLVVFFLALHTKVSPLFLGISYHHCVFCLWQDSVLSLAFTILIVAGLCVAFSQPLILLLTPRSAYAAVHAVLGKVARYGLASLLGGIVLLVAGVIWKTSS